MRVTDKAIVIQNVKYGDRKHILKLYTRNHGLLSAVAVTGSSPSSKIKSAVLQPLSLLEVQIVRKQNRDVQQLTEASCYYVSHQVPVSFSRLSIAQFMHEVLLRSMREQGANPHLFDFLENCLRYLNESDSYINLHLHFMSELCKYLGIEPNNNYSKQETYFDCREGIFTSYPLSFPLGLNEEDSLLFSEALRVNCLESNISNLQRQRLLEIWTAWYELHIPAFGQLKSAAVLKDLMVQEQGQRASS